MAGGLLGIADLLQLEMEWYFIPAILCMAGAALLGLLVIVALFDVVNSRFWTLLLLVGSVYGFVLGLLVAIVLAVIAVLVIAALMFYCVAGATFKTLEEESREQKTELSDGTVITRICSGPWRDSSGQQYTNVYGDTFRRDD